MTNDIFAENAWYFRNALVRANYTDLKNGIQKTTEYLEVFLRNLLLNENHPLHNRTLHISEAFNETEKVNIESQKANIENLFTPKTASHVQHLLTTFGFQTDFGRSDVQQALGLKSTRSSTLIREMTEQNLIEPISGHGKGKYHFRSENTSY